MKVNTKLYLQGWNIVLLSKFWVMQILAKKHLADILLFNSERVKSDALV